MEVGVEVEVLLNGEVLVEPELLRHVADAVLHRLRVAGDVDAEHVEVAAVGRQQPGDQADERRLAGAVGADQRRQPAVLDGERDVVERRDGLAGLALEALADVAAGDGGTGGVHFAAVAGWSAVRCDGRRHAEAQHVVRVVDQDAHLVDEAGAQFLRLDRARREFRDRRDEADVAGEACCAVAVDRDGRRVARRDLGQVRLRDVGAHPFRVDDGDRERPASAAEAISPGSSSRERTMPATGAFRSRRRAAA